MGLRAELWRENTSPNPQVGHTKGVVALFEHSLACMVLCPCQSVGFIVLQNIFFNRNNIRNGCFQGWLTELYLTRFCNLYLTNLHVKNSIIKPNQPSESLWAGTSLASVPANVGTPVVPFPFQWGQVIEHGQAPFWGRESEMSFELSSEDGGSKRVAGLRQRPRQEFLICGQWTPVGSP